MKRQRKKTNPIFVFNVITTLFCICCMYGAYLAIGYIFRIPSDEEYQAEYQAKIERKKEREEKSSVSSYKAPKKESVSYNLPKRIVTVNKDPYDQCKAETRLNTLCDVPSPSSSKVCMYAMRDYHLCLKRKGIK